METQPPQILEMALTLPESERALLATTLIRSLDDAPDPEADASWALPRMDRSIVRLTTLEQQGLDSGVPDATPTERLLMVWPLTLTAWASKEPNVVQPRLQRHVARVVRREN